MGRSNNNDRRKSMNAAKTFTEVIISLALVAGCGYLLKIVADRTTVVGSCPFYQEAEEEPAEEEIDPNKIIFENSYVASDDVKKGDLILVNESHQYFPEDDLDSHLVSVNEKLTDKEITFYSGVDNFDSYGEMKVHETIFEPMNSMIEDFYNKTEITDIVIYGGYRSTEFQQSLYEGDLIATGEEDSTRVAKAGFSEHETGYAFDFSKLPTTITTARANIHGSPRTATNTALSSDTRRTSRISQRYSTNRGISAIQARLTHIT